MHPRTTKNCTMQLNIEVHRVENELRMIIEHLLKYTRFVRYE